MIRLLIFCLLLGGCTSLDPEEARARHECRQANMQYTAPQYGGFGTGLAAAQSGWNLDYEGYGLCVRGAGY